MIGQSKFSREIGLADLIKSLNQLSWQNEEHEKAIFNALGFKWQGASLDKLTPEKPKTIASNKYYRKKRSADKRLDISAIKAAPPTPELPVELPKTVLTSKLKPLEQDFSVGDDWPAWLNNKAEVDKFLLEECLDAKPARAGLFSALTHRGILVAALKVQKTSKTIDLEALIGDLVKGRIPQRLPYKTTITLENGCHLLLDYSESMTPYWEDLSALADQTENLVGRNRVKVYEFDQNPNLAECWPSYGEEPESWQFESGRPILVASNLGITGRQRCISLTPDWRTFIERCRNKKHPLLILTPWPQEYWPDGLGSHPMVVPWTSSTTAGMLNSLVGKGHKINP